MNNKIFILDTNVILYDYNCIYNFDDNDIVIPITVLEEIDRFKRGGDQINFNAREFIRIIDEFSGEKLVKDGENISSNGGKIRIIVDHQNELRVNESFLDMCADHRILSVAYYLTKHYENRQVILVSKDVNLRLKANSLNIIANDYLTTHIDNLKNLYTGKRIIEINDKEIDIINKGGDVINNNIISIKELTSNEYLLLQGQKKSVMAYFNPIINKIQRIPAIIAYGINPRSAEQTFALHALINSDIKLVTFSGKAGTGKTLLALAGSLMMRKEFRQIYLARPIVSLSNKDMGYLPGNIDEKMDPYMQPLYDNLNVIKNQYNETSADYKRINNMLKNKKLFIAPLAYIRGRSLEKIFFIVDEAQNLTPHEIKTIITRAGEGTKIVLTGDPYQIDTPYLDARSNGLTHLIEKMRGQKLYAHITLERGERSHLAELASDLL